MAISIVNTYAKQTGSGNASATFTFPAATAGNLLLVVVGYYNGSTATLTTPAGWNIAIDSGSSESTGRLVVLWKKAAGGETSVTLNWSANAYRGIGGYELAGADTYAPINGASHHGQPAATSWPSPGVVGSIVGCLPFAFCVENSNATQPTVSGGWTLDTWTTASEYVGLAHGPLTTDTTTSQTTTFTMGASLSGECATMLISPAPPTLTATPNMLTLVAGNTGTSTISGGDTPYNAVVGTSNSSVATATISGSTVTVTAVAPGTATLTVTDAGGATVTIAVTVNAAGVTTTLTLRDLVQADTQERTLVVQVWRNGNWVTVPCNAAQARTGRGKAGELTLEIPDNPADPRAQLYEGERIRVYRGVTGASSVRCWTGYVDIRGPKMSASQGGTFRSITVTDNIKELIEAKFLAGVIYDGWAPNAACADVVQRAINTGQYKVYDDNGNQLTSTAGYNSPTGNGICDFPDLFNDDGSTFTLPQGTIASYGTASSMASFSVPNAASGTVFAAFEASKNHFIGSTANVPGWTVASTAMSMPPPQGTMIADWYNGVFYFNAADASRTVSMSVAYYDRPLYEVNNGKNVNDFIQAIFTAVGCTYTVDGAGKLHAKQQDVVQAPTRIFGANSAVDLGVQINRDRRNVILCLGWDTTCGGIIASKGVNYDDIQNAPPTGLGKRAYMYLQDKKWNTQFAVNRACIYALTRVSRRGKIASVQVLDDPSLKINDVIAFADIMPEISPNDFFFVDQLDWEISAKGGKVRAVQTLAGTAIPGQGTFYIGPIAGATNEGQFDLSADVRPIFNCALSPAGGSYNSSFSLATGLQLVYSVGSLAGTETISYYRPDGTVATIEQNVARSASSTYTVSLPLTGVNPGDLIVVKLYFKDSNGNIGIYRDWIQARP